MANAVIYWSATGNTEAMAQAVAEGAGTTAVTFGEFSGDIAELDAVAFGCPAMGAEELEDTEVEPFFAANESKLAGKKVVLFGSYDWGDGEWMRLWAERVKAAGADLVAEGLICNLTPDDDAIAACKALGEKIK